MKAVVFGGILLFTLITMLTPVKALNITDTVFDGTFHNTTVFESSLVLENQTGEFYYLEGNFTSVILDPGYVVDWTTFSMDSIIPENTSLDFFVTFGNTTEPDSSWINDSGIARYAVYTLIFKTQYNKTTPQVNQVELNYELVEPLVFLNTPEHESTSLSKDVTFNCSALSVNNLANMTFYSNVSGTWEQGSTQTLAGKEDNESFTIQNLDDGIYEWNCKVIDETGQEAFHDTNYLVRVASENLGPEIEHSITPVIVANNSIVELGIIATHPEGIDKVWAVITLPNTSEVTMTLINNGDIDYTTTMLGEHIVTFNANDSLGKAVSVKDKFDVNEMIDFNITVQDKENSGLKSELKILKNNKIINSYSENDGVFSNSILEGDYDLLFSAFDGDFEVLLRDVDITQEETLRLDSMTNLLGYTQVFAVDNDFSIDDGWVKITYDTDLFGNQENISLYKCNNWNFENRECDSSFSVVEDLVHEKQSNTIELNVSSFSAFALKQESYCGDDVCDTGESESSCPEDCTCDNGETRECGDNDKGECSLGTQTCVNGQWSQCVGQKGPISEVCNQKDDNCDGIIDNVFGGTTIQETKCQCYDGIPLEEDCNSIDDDCDGIIDSFSLSCGSNVGTCTEGSKLCINGVFQECSGSIEPLDQEICNNLEDDNCNNIVDEGCPNCFNNLMDGDETGVDCGGSCKNCPEFPFYIIIIVVVIILIVVAIFILKNKKETSWDDLERKYSYNPLNRE